MPFSHTTLSHSTQGPSLQTIPIFYYHVLGMILGTWKVQQVGVPGDFNTIPVNDGFK